MTRPVVFDSEDGKKRVLITIDHDGKFEPVLWFYMNQLENDGGITEATVVCQHAALILAQDAWVRRQQLASAENRFAKPAENGPLQSGFQRQTPMGPEDEDGS
jgi:hypothetical protein